MKKFEKHKKKVGVRQDYLESFTIECNPEFPARWQHIMFGSSKRFIMIPTFYNQSWGSAGLSYRGQWLAIDNCCGVTEPMPLPKAGKPGPRFWSKLLTDYYTDKDSLRLLARAKNAKRYVEVKL